MIDLSRSEILLGADALARLRSSHAAVIGVGGVGSWCAEALVRTGVGRITIVDDDVVAASNVNRQCPATSETVGMRKVDAMRERLLAINPDCAVNAANVRYGADGSALDVAAFDCIVDAIDSVDAKAALILAATEAGVPLVSSMGAAGRLDPTKVVLRRFDRVEGDGLARALRRRFRRLGRFPAAKFVCAVSTEQAMTSAGEKGSFMPVTCAFGMALASEAVRLVSRLTCE